MILSGNRSQVKLQYKRGRVQWSQRSDKVTVQTRGSDQVTEITVQNETYDQVLEVTVQRSE